VFDAAATKAACLFCGSLSLEAAPPDEPIPVPQGRLPMLIDATHADASYRAWATASWLRPKVLRSLGVALHPMHIPAWRYDSSLETHWAGLVRAATASGKRPVAGVDHTRIRHMVPASAGLSQAELIELQPFVEEGAQEWDPGVQDLPWEPPALTERGARPRAHHIMAQHHGRAIAAEHDLVRWKVSPVIEDHDVRLFMVPVYVGSFSYRNRPWRFLVNACTGELVGEAPLDWLKIALLVLGVLVVVGAAIGLATGLA
jgi:hypothetical protein